MFAFGWPRPSEVYRSASCWQVCPVKDEVHGSDGTHQLSVAML